MDALDEQVRMGGGSGTVSVVLRPTERRLLETSAEERRRALERLEAEEPEVALLAVAFWAEVLELAEARLMAAGVRARREGETWAAIGAAWGNRPNQNAARKFGPAAREGAGGD